MKAGLEKDKAALLVVIGARSDGRKEILAVRPGHRESTESWRVLRDLQDRGLPAPRLAQSGSAPGITRSFNVLETCRSACRARPGRC